MVLFVLELHFLFKKKKKIQTKNEVVIFKFNTPASATLYNLNP